MNINVKSNALLFLICMSYLGVLPIIMLFVFLRHNKFVTA